MRSIKSYFARKTIDSRKLNFNLGLSSLDLSSFYLSSLDLRSLGLRQLVSVTALAILLSSTPKIAQSTDGPIKLSDEALDQISAGYVNLILTSTATATGTNAVTISVTDSNVNSRPGRGNRTVSTGSALAEAIGDIVATETGYILDTDEQILSLHLIQTITNSEGGSTTIRIRINRRGRVIVSTNHRPPRHHHNGGGVITETNQLNVHVVTSSNSNRPGRGHQNI